MKFQIHQGFGKIQHKCIRWGILLGAALAVSACAVGAGNKAANNTVPLSSEEQMLRHKYRGINGLVLRIDAASRKEGVTITTETGGYIDSPGLLGPGGSANIVSSRPIPKAVRATWRVGKFEQKPGGGGWNGGTIIGDYTVPVAERIPDDILDYIRKNGGALRLKIRLKDDGVLIGWDVEERYTTQYGRGVRWVLPGGDFREAQIFNGKVIDPGWQN
jgi:hypothetical protein